MIGNDTTLTREPMTRLAGHVGMDGALRLCNAAQLRETVHQHMQRRYALDSWRGGSGSFSAWHTPTFSALRVHG